MIYFLYFSDALPLSLNSEFLESAFVSGVNTIFVRNVLWNISSGHRSVLFATKTLWVSSTLLKVGRILKFEHIEVFIFLYFNFREIYNWSDFFRIG